MNGESGYRQCSLRGALNRIIAPITFSSILSQLNVCVSMPLAKHGSFCSMYACVASHHNYAKIILLNIDFHVNSIIYIHVQCHVRIIHILFPRSHNHVHVGVARPGA